MNRPARSNDDNLPLAISAILFTVFALALGDALIKRFSTDFTLWQVFVLRSVLALPVLTVFIKLRYKGTSLIPQFVTWTALRSLMLTIMWVAYYTALPHMALSVAAAAYYTLPIFITLFASLFIGEKIGTRSWVAVFLGFCGVLLILRPQADDFNAYALLPVVSAILYALAMIITRTKCKNEHVLVLSLALNVSMIIVGGVAALLIWLWNPADATVLGNPFLLDQWSAMGQDDWLVMGFLAVAIIVGSVGAAIAYQSGPSSVVGTFDFAYVAFAACWGYLLFAEVPDAITITGMALVVIAGVLAVRK